MTKLNGPPILFVDVDGVISVFGFSPAGDELPGPFHWIDGIAHCIPVDVGLRLGRLSTRFELVWATGWEEKANEYLPYILGLPVRELPCLLFEGRAVFGSAHWKLDAIDEYAGGRPAPTLLVETESAIGLTDEHVRRLFDWDDALRAARPA